MKQFRKKILACMLAVVLTLTMGVGFSAVDAYAASGNVYTCDITGGYRHPVTGTIEDSGGEGSYDIGQGMCSSVQYSNGILEVTDSGEYYLTIRLSLMDYTSNHSFWVQNVGDSSWANTSYGVTANGTDSNGTTADITIQVPSENCVIRASMYVEPMGRDAIWYIYPSNYSAGNSTDMNPYIVTSASGSDSEAAAQSGDSSTPAASSSGSSLQSSGGTSAADAIASAGAATGGNSAGSLQSSSTGTDTGSSAALGSSSPELSSTVDQAAAAAGTAATGTDSTLDSAAGLSLSTETEAAAEDTASASSTKVIVVRAAAFTVSALIILAAGAFVVYLFRKNWKSWGHEYEDDDDEE